MSASPNAASWSVWTAAGTLAVVTTRNPLYLVLIGAAVGASYLSRDHGTATRGAWRLILRIGLVVAVVGIGFNLLTVHAGDHVIVSLPDAVPIVGGAVTVNALVYGLASAAALLDLLLIAATFSAAVDRPSLLRLVPEQFVASGVAAVVALSVFPQTLRAAAEVREAQATRGFRVRSARDLTPLLVPTLRLGLEHAFDLAEAMESRAFGSGIAAPAMGRRRLSLGLLAGSTAVVMLGLARPLLAAPPALVAVVALLRPGAHRRARRERYRPFTWGPMDAVVVGAAALAAGLLMATLLGSDALSYAPYPSLGWPPFSLPPALAGLCLAAPAVVGLWSTR